MLRILCSSVGVGTFIQTQNLFDQHKFDDKIETELNQNKVKQKCRELVQRKQCEAGAPGLVVAVSVDGRTVWSEGFGLADVENNVPCHPDTVMRVASISKSFTATAMARLWESGKLDLDKSVQDYLPDFPEKFCDGQKVTITLRQLLSHLGGIRHYDKPSKPDLSASNSDTANSKHTGKDNKEEFKMQEYYIKEHFSTVTDALKLFKDDPLVNNPGQKYLYTTHGWTLVSAILEKVADQQFLSLMLDNFRILGMTQTVPDCHEQLIYGRARYYQRTKSGKLVNAPYVDNSYKWAGGGFLSTVGDLIKFGNCMMYSYQNRDVSDGILKPETVRMLWNPAAKEERKRDSKKFENETYGMGWYVYPVMEKRGLCPDWQLEVSHTGGAIGASSVLFLLPDSNSHHHLPTPRQSVASSSNTPNHRDLSNSGSQQDGAVIQTCVGVRGVVVAIITNMQAVGLNGLARTIAHEFDDALRSE